MPVIITCYKIYQFQLNNPDKIPYHIAEYYTGEEVETEIYCEVYNDVFFDKRNYEISQAGDFIIARYNPDYNSSFSWLIECITHKPTKFFNSPRLSFT